MPGARIPRERLASKHPETPIDGYGQPGFIPSACQGNYERLCADRVGGAWFTKARAGVAHSDTLSHAIIRFIPHVPRKIRRSSASCFAKVHARCRASEATDVCEQSGCQTQANLPRPSRCYRPRLHRSSACSYTHNPTRWKPHTAWRTCGRTSAPSRQPMQLHRSRMAQRD